MKPINIPTPEEIRIAIKSGEEAQLALYGQMLQTIYQLVERVQALEDQLAKKSNNSSKPPSSDGLNKPAPKSQRKRHGRKSGGQPGHEGHTLKVVSKPNHVIVHSVHKCHNCEISLRKEKVIRYEKRQVYDIPPVQMEVTEHRAEVKHCSGCGKDITGVFPKGVTQAVQYGPEVKSQAIYLNQYQMIPLGRVCEAFEDLYKHRLAEGTIITACQEASKMVRRVNQSVKSYLTEKAEAVHFDETGLRINGKLHWLHVACTGKLTYYEEHIKRGQKAISKIGILPGLQGVAIHDGWKSYLAYENIPHGLCNAHHLRELEFVGERYPQAWVQKLTDLLHEIKKTVDLVRKTSLGLADDQIADFSRRYDEFVKQGLAENPTSEQKETDEVKRGRKKQSPPKNLLDRLFAYKFAVLAFMYNFKVPFDNNQAERDIRMMKVKQKISGCFRSEEGADTFCQIRSYISTARKNKQNVMKVLRLAFASKPFLPDFVTLIQAE